MLSSYLPQCPLGRHLLSCTKCLHLLLSVGLLGVAIAALYVTITSFVDEGSELAVYFHYSKLNVIIITACAGILALATLLGIYSSTRTSFDGLVASATVLSLLVLGTIGYSIWQGITVEYVKDSKLHKQLKKEVEDYAGPREVINHLQHTLSCCGVESFTDWGNKIPKSCCPPDSKETCDVNNSLLNKQGCFKELKTFLSSYNWMILLSLGFIDAVQIAVAVLSYMLCRTIHYANKRQKDLENGVQIPRVASPNPEPEPAPEGDPAAEGDPAPKEDPIPEAPPMPETEPPKEEEVKCIQTPKVVRRHIS